MISKYIILSFLIGLIHLNDGAAQERKVPQKAIESKVRFNKGILTSKLDYLLIPTDDRKFTLIITNAKQSNFKVRIYDVIGNLILSEDLLDAQNGEKEYDFSDSKTKIFVVKVAAGKETMTKKVTI